MTASKSSFKGLAPWRPLVAVQEVLFHVLLAAFALWAGIGYLGLMLVFAAEMFLGNLVSVAVYPERGLRRHAWDLVKFVLAMGFLFVFVLATYAIARGGMQSPADLMEAVRLERDAAGASAAFAAAHTGVLYFIARRAPDPKFAWARSVLVQNAATFVTMLLMIFVAAFAGAALSGVAEWWNSTAPIDAALIVLTAGMRLFFALLVSRMPEREMRDIAHQPYID